MTNRLEWEKTIDAPEDAVLADETTDSLILAFNNQGSSKERGTDEGEYLPESAWEDSLYFIPEGSSFGTKRLPESNPYYFLNKADGTNEFGIITQAEPPSPYDRFPDDCVTAVKLDANGDETDEIYHFYRTNRYMSEFQHLYNDLISELGANERVNVYCGNDISHLSQSDSITIADSLQPYNTYRRSVAMFKYPANWTALVTNTDRGNLETMSRNGSFLGVETVVLPTKLISIPESMFYSLSYLANVIFRKDADGAYKTERLEKYAFYNCSSLTALTLPGSITYINSYYGAFRNMTNLRTISIAKAEGSISGAPWGATNATVIWTG